MGLVDEPSGMVSFCFLRLLLHAYFFYSFVATALYSLESFLFNRADADTIDADRQGLCAALGRREATNAQTRPQGPRQATQ